MAQPSDDEMNLDPMLIVYAVLIMAAAILIPIASGILLFWIS
jgi:hypothetical protein